MKMLSDLKTNELIILRASLIGVHKPPSCSKLRIGSGVMVPVADVASQCTIKPSVQQLILAAPTARRLVTGLRCVGRVRDLRFLDVETGPDHVDLPQELVKESEILRIYALQPSSNMPTHDKWAQTVTLLGRPTWFRLTWVQGATH